MHLTKVCCLLHCFFFPGMSSRKSVGDCCWQHGRSFESRGMWRRKAVDDSGLQNSRSFVNSSFDQSEYVDIFMDDAVPNRLQGVVGAASRCCSNRPKRQHSRQQCRRERRWLSKFLVRVPTDTQQNQKTTRFSSVSGLCPTRTRRRKRSASDTIAMPLVDWTHNDDAFVVVFKHRPIAHELFSMKTEQRFCRCHSHRTKPEPSGCPVRKTSELKVLGAPTRETRLRVVSSESGGEQARACSERQHFFGSPPAMASLCPCGHPHARRGIAECTHSMEAAPWAAHVHFASGLVCHTFLVVVVLVFLFSNRQWHCCIRSRRPPCSTCFRSRWWSRSCFIIHRARFQEVAVR